MIATVASGAAHVAKTLLYIGRRVTQADRLARRATSYNDTGQRPPTARVRTDRRTVKWKDLSPVDSTTVQPLPRPPRLKKNLGHCSMPYNVGFRCRHIG